MIFRKRRERREQELRRQRIVAELRELQKECKAPGSRGFVHDMILYAEVGAGRMTLPDSWVSDTRAEIETWNREWEKLTA